MFLKTLLYQTIYLMIQGFSFDIQSYKNSPEYQTALKIVSDLARGMSGAIRRRTSGVSLDFAAVTQRIRRRSRPHHRAVSHVPLAARLLGGVACFPTINVQIGFVFLALRRNEA
jgi:hypothetical protein